MKILIACEFSGIIRDAFIAKGHNVWSCDLLPTEKVGPHIQDDVLKILENGWDMMIAHPPCTYLSYSGIAHWNENGRVFKRLKALEFFAKLWTAPIEKICIENPKGCASPTIAKYNQIIQPYYFGEPEYKTTWLWLKNLPKLIHYKNDTFFEKSTHTNKPEPKAYTKTGKALHWTEYKKFSDDRAQIRSKTFLVIAEAMAEQWG